ncbi:hypothetical protein RSAG8_05381, partial [Rhizoctonia solani AG-8 WAC10335]
MSPRDKQRQAKPNEQCAHEQTEVTRESSSVSRTLHHLINEPRLWIDCWHSNSPTHFDFISVL